MSNIIEIKNLTKKFKDFVAVDNISFSVRAGDVFAFLGPNGAGKTTTIKILTTLLRPTEGSLLIESCDPLKDKNGARKSFGIIFQDPSLDDELTAYENMDFHGILYGMSGVNRKERIKQLLVVVDLWERRKEPVKNFSGGMKRRLEIARGLLHHPKILFLDEPTVGLDPQTRNYIWSYLKKMNQTEGVTVFLTTHYLEEAEAMANQVAIIDHGKIVTQGSPEEIKTQTNTQSLEGAFLVLTGDGIREEKVGATDVMRQHRKMFHH